MHYEVIRVPAYRRSVFQIAVLMFATLGFYVFVWSFFTRRTCAAILERPDQPLWKSVALIVPLFNFFMMFDLGKRIEGIVGYIAVGAAQGSSGAKYIRLSSHGFFL